MVHCGACGKFLSPAGAVTCSICPLKYHRACLVIADKAQISKDWACPGCKKSTKRTDNTPVKGMCDAVDVGVPSPPRAVPGSPIHESIDTASISDFRREFTEGMAEIREFRKEMAQLRESLSAITTRLDGVERRIEVLEQHRSTEGHERDIELERTIAELKSELNVRDQEALLSDLEIGHLPEERGENVVHTVAVLASRLGVTLEERDVVFAERVGAPPAPGVAGAGRARRVVVRLARRHLRDELLRAARVRRTITATDGARIYLNERLTRHNRQLFHRIREECGRLKWRYSWTKQGRLYARRGDGQTVFKISSDADLLRVFGPPCSD